MIVQEVETDGESTLFAFKPKSHIDSLRELRVFLHKLLRGCNVDERYYPHTGLVHVKITTVQGLSWSEIVLVVIGLALIVWGLSR